MKKVNIYNFKAYSKPFKIEIPEGNNLLICGENGSGKSSLFEAMQLAYSRERIYANITKMGANPLDKGRLWNDYLERLRYQKNQGQAFSIEIDDVSYDVFDTDNIEAYFISDRLMSQDVIDLSSILLNMNVAESEVETIIKEWHKSIFEELNSCLHDYFYENISVNLLDDGTNHCKIIDKNRGLERDSDFVHYFNESKLKLIFILLALSFAFVGYMKADGKKKLLVLDDIVTSLDLMNREFLIKYLLTRFSNVQMIVLTHNVGFFNLFRYNVNVLTNNSPWVYKSIYEVNGENRNYDFKENTVESLRKRLSEGEAPTQVGNDIRKRFESLLVELARLQGLDPRPDKLNEVISGLIKNELIYVKKINNRVFYADTLAKDIDKLTMNIPDNALLRTKIIEKIDSYKSAKDEFAPFVADIKDMNIYQKLVLHQLSHATHLSPTFSIAEESVTLDLLERLEKYVTSKREFHNGGDIETL